MRKYINQKMLKHLYPFTTPEGHIVVLLSNQVMSDGTQIPYILFETPEDTFALNGSARASGNYRDYEDIWKEHPKKPGAKVPTSKVMELAATLLQKEHPVIHQRVFAHDNKGAAHDRHSGTRDRFG